MTDCLSVYADCSFNVWSFEIENYALAFPVGGNFYVSFVECFAYIILFGSEEKRKLYISFLAIRGIAVGMVV